MADTTESKKVTSDPKTNALDQEAKPEDKTPAINRNADDALQLLESASALDALDPHISKRLLRRIDIYIMPLICTSVFCFAFLEAISNSNPASTSYNI
jgi:ACS family allantoate permease-like MFS transporter